MPFYWRWKSCYCLTIIIVLPDRIKAHFLHLVCVFSVSSESVSDACIGLEVRKTWFSERNSYQVRRLNTWRMIIWPVYCVTITGPGFTHRSLYTSSHDDLAQESGVSCLLHQTDKLYITWSYFCFLFCRKWDTVRSFHAHTVWILIWCICQFLL